MRTSATAVATRRWFDDPEAARSGCEHLMMSEWIRSHRAAVVDIGDAVVLVSRDTLHTLDGESGELARVVLGHLARPRSEADVIARIEELAGPLGERREVVRQLLGLLAETGATSRVEPVATRLDGANIVVCVSGAIAATHAPAFVAALQRRGHTVEVALTATAQRFVGVDALAAIVQREVHTSTWPRAPHAPVPHVALAAWAELVIVYPASATTIARIANGDFSDLVAAIALTTRAPVVIVPSMNAAMLDSPAVERNLATLRADGHVIVHGVPSQEVADAPSRRDTIGGVAPAPGEVAQLVDALRAHRVLRGATERTWDAAYRAPLVPWASATCDPDLAAALAAHAPSRSRVLDVGCGLGQVARHAAAAGHRVVATEVSEIALALARRTDDSIVWLRDDICATALAGTFDVIVDRAMLHALPPERLAAWSVAIRRLAAERAIVIVKAHRDGVAGITTGWSAARLAALLPGFEVVDETPAELPGLVDAKPIPSLLVILQRLEIER